MRRRAAVPPRGLKRSTPRREGHDPLCARTRAVLPAAVVLGVLVHPATVALPAAEPPHRPDPKPA